MRGEEIDGGIDRAFRRGWQVSLERMKREMEEDEELSQPAKDRVREIIDKLRRQV